MNEFLQSLDIVTFVRVILFCIQRKKETTFIKYFNEYYNNRREKLPYCYIARLGGSTNMKFERWHTQLKYGRSWRDHPKEIG